MLRILAFLFLALAAAAATPKTRNVIFVSTDGLRWQEVFRGADEALITKTMGGVTNEAALREKYWDPSPEVRRQKLMPWLWSELATKGQIFGNREIGSEVNCSNPLFFSYPGYNEFLTGHADERIISNKAIPNANTNVLEFLHGRPGFQGKVNAYLAWDVIAWVLNGPRCGFPIWTSTGKAPPRTIMPRHPEIEHFRDETTLPWSDEHFDSFVHAAAMECLRNTKPRVLYISYGETDEWGHGKRYDNYLTSTNRLDRWLRELWETAQSMPEYQGTTSLVFTTDHGRGLGESWTSHGEKIVESGEMWLAVLGPDTKPLGERRQISRISQAQIAATVAALLGEDYRNAVPEAAEAVSDVLSLRQ
jgi:Type I phosphodiesterase / nucleotide pyrophosphatase